MPCFVCVQEKGARKFACILAFDVPVTREARDLAESMGVRIFSADIIYHLFDQFTAYLKQACVCVQRASRAVLDGRAVERLTVRTPIVAGLRMNDSRRDALTPVVCNPA